jgi:hypothetical protein
MNKNFQPMVMQGSGYYGKGLPNPMNVAAQSTGRQSGYQSNFNSYQTAFQPLLPEFHEPYQGHQQKSMFNNHDFINDGTLLHNNLYPNILTEEIKEYSVLIDSKDRNYQIFPNPFRYDVTFNPVHSAKERVDGKIVSYEDPNPVINKGFENVRYIKLEDVILPFHNRTFKHTRKLDEPDERGLDAYVTEEFVDTHHPITENLYTILVIDEYRDVNIKSTNDVLSDSFAVIYKHSKANESHFNGFTNNAIKVFPPDQLGKIDKFRIRFLDPYGNELKCKHLDKRIKSGMVCTCDDDNDIYQPDCFKHCINHPLNPLFQNHLHFKIGVVESYMNKKLLA